MLIKEVRVPGTPKIKVFIVALGVTILFGMLGGNENFRLVPGYSSIAPDLTKSKQQSRARHFAEIAKRVADGVGRGFSAVTALSHTVRPGETISAIWTKYGSTKERAQSAESALRLLNAHKLKAGETVDLQLSDSGGVLGFSKELTNGQRLVLDSSKTSGYAASLVSIPTEEQERTVSGNIESSLFNAAVERDVPYEVVDQFVDLFSDKVEFRRDLQPGDTFTIIYDQYVNPSGEVVRTDTIRSASLYTGGKLMAVVSHQGSDGKIHYYDQGGNLIGNYFLRYPLKFSRISSAFSSARFHPVLGIRRPHNGVDFAAPTGTAVRSVADGIVEYVGFDSSSGKAIKIRHDGRYTTAYLHLSKFASGLHRGSRITRGEVIGAVGQTGLATGPHLHFSLFDRGKFVNPLMAQLPVIGSDTQSIPKTVLAAELGRLEAERSKLMLAMNNGDSAKRHS